MITPFNWYRNYETLFLLGELKKDLLNPLWNIRYKAMKGIRKIDLRSVTYVDTVGLALLVHLISIGKEYGANIVLTYLHRSVRSLAEIYHLPKDLFPY